MTERYQFFDRVQEMLTNCGKTGAQLERDLNLSRGSIYKWKKSDPNMETLIKLADYFDSSLDYLLCRDSDEPALPQDERRLLSFYRSMTQDGKDRLFEQAELIAGKYVKKTMDNKDVIA